ncbi:unnamed protein product [Adineta ricciae]|uniref:Uncharacterized protein n=1 Tax=Adineta ricciae TaxID=249248 RepID=A0A815JSE2_ADIRI|nr:unnamed protein product [Adineta ricciae]CAF1383852.1 unnamed protein product [Adineta ricciae]
MSSRYHQYSNDDLIRMEVKHRRRANRIKAGMGMSISAGMGSILATGGVAAPIVIPLFGYKLYKMISHENKRDEIREELARRDISPKKKTVGDVLNYVVGVGLPVVTHGISQGIHVL